MTAAFDVYVAAITGLTDSGSTVSEDDLKPPVKSFVEALAADSHPTAGMHVRLEVSVKSGNTVVGRPDLTVLDKGGRVVGYVELKHLSKSADPTVLTGHDKMQWETGFAALPNIVYTNGTHATLWHYGTQVGEAALADAAETQHVWQEFLDYAPQPIKDPRRLAVAFGRRARRLREAVEAALSRQQGQSIQLRDVWRASMDADMTDSEFADNFAQVAVSALLLAKGEMQQTPSDLLSAVTALRQSGFSLVSEVLQHVDTVSSQDDEIAIALAAVVDTVASTDSANLSDDGWWLTFYEAFISEYDAGLQKERGVFYTPSEIVDFQLEACDWVLRHTLNLSDGYASRNVTVLDPACGTGTYLTRLVDKLVEDTAANLGEGAVPETVASLLERIYGFEIMPAPYTISQTRLAAKSKAHQTPARETVLLTDTLSSTGLNITNSLFADELTKQQQRANDIKDPKTRVTVVVGNPPYARVPVKHQSRGGIVTGGLNLFKDFKNKTPPPMSKQLRVAYEMALYFWRWSIWKVCEQTHPNRSEAGDAGIVSFISPASWLTADGCAGVRAHMRDKFDDIWIVDLGGDQRAVRKDGDNVFPIQTPVCIAVAVRGAQTTNQPARVHYHRVVAGTRHDKLNALKDIKLADIAAWDRCPTGSTDPFTPAGAAGWYASQPLLTDVLEWRSPGVKYNRTWPIALTPQTATNRWDTLMAASATQRSELFKENVNRNLNSKKKRLPHTNPPHPSAPIADLPAGTPSPHPQPYSYRPFDTRVALADNRLCNDPRPPLWEAHSSKQAYLVTPSDTDPGSEGPCAVVYTELPDYHGHHGRGGGVTPLWRDRNATEPNANPLLVADLTSRYGQQVTGEQLWYYCAGLLGTSSYTAVWYHEMGATRRIHIPFPDTHNDFLQIMDVGYQLVSNARGHTSIKSNVKCVTPVNSNRLPDFNPAKCWEPATHKLHLGGGTFTGVTPEIWHHEVSGYKTLQRWIRARSRQPGGKTSSPLDQIRPTNWAFTKDLINVCHQIATLNHLANITAPIIQQLNTTQPAAP